MLIDFEKVDMNLLNIIQLLNNVQNMLFLPELGSIAGAGDFVLALDNFRANISLEIERQGII